MDTIHGPIASHLLKQVPMDDQTDTYWKLRVAEMIASPRFNIPVGNMPVGNMPVGNMPVGNSMELYVYDQLLPGMTTWKQYYHFLIDMIDDLQ